MALRNIKLTVSYDGSRYRGWQAQPGFPTIQETLRHAVEELFGCGQRPGAPPKVNVHGASRTDAGVSAIGQVALVQIDSTCPIPVDNIPRALTQRLPEDIAVIDAEEMPTGFDLIGGAVSKLYRYRIFTGRTRPVMDIRHCWHYPKRLDIDAMNRAAALMKGTKDYRSFASAADRRKDTVRTIYSCEVRADGDWVEVEVEGSAFLYNMVRNMVGTLVEVGAGRWKPEKVTEILAAGHRSAAGPIAPAAGLCLVRVKY
jgi:tRNA pseudouridine38-40 synthase